APPIATWSASSNASAEQLALALLDHRAVRVEHDLDAAVGRLVVLRDRAVLAKRERGELGRIDLRLVLQVVDDLQRARRRQLPVRLERERRSLGLLVL